MLSVCRSVDSSGISGTQASVSSGIKPPLEEILTYSTAGMSSLAFPLTPTLCGQFHTQPSPRHLRK